MATSLGRYGQTDHPEVQEAMRLAEQAILKSRVVLGGLSFSTEQTNQIVDRGCRILFLGFDWSMLQKGTAAALDGIKRS